MNARRRRGAITVMSALLLVVFAAFLALAIDLGYLYCARTELQRSADAGAMAGAWELIDENALTGSSAQTTTLARAAATDFVGRNKVLGKQAGLLTSDVEVGYLTSFTDQSQAIKTDSLQSYNAVHVTVRRDSSINGEVPLCFARLLGLDSESLRGEATAAIVTQVGGFKAPSSGGNLGILPFALDDTTWNALMAGTGSDSWTWDATTSQVSAGADGIKEVNLYPQGTGSPGNRGTVDIGSSNNSTADISRQIRYGITPQDLTYHGGELKFDSNGELPLNGDTGISAGVKDDLASIIGEPRIIPIFKKVVGPGNNATYTIVKWVGIRILDVKLTGSMSSKKLIVQPANVVVRGAVPTTTKGTSAYLYSPVWLVK